MTRRPMAQEVTHLRGAATEPHQVVQGHGDVLLVGALALGGRPGNAHDPLPHLQPLREALRNRPRAQVLYLAHACGSGSAQVLHGMDKVMEQHG